MALQDAKIRLHVLKRFVTRGPGNPESPRWWKTLCGIVIPALVAMLCGFLLWTLVPPTVNFPLFVLAGFALILLGAAWLAAAIWGAVRYRSYLRSAIAPVIVAVTTALTYANAPFQLGFLLSKDDLTRASVACSADSDGWVGVYDVRRVESRDGGCLFFTSGGLINPVGIAYMPSGAPNLGSPRHEGDIAYDRIDGDWYTFWQLF